MATIPEAFAIAVQHQQAGRLQAAEQIYRQILQVDPNQAGAIHLLGVIALQTGRPAAAIETIGRAIRLNADAAEFHFNLAEAYRALRRLPEAAVGYRRALELKPELAEAHWRLGHVFMEQKQPDEAAVCFRRALELKPSLAAAHNSLGVACKELGDLKEAVTCYRRASELDPDFAEAHNNLGNALKEQGQLDEAIGCYRRALQLKPDLAETHCNLGAVYQARGNLEEEVACYRRALELAPGFAAAHNNLGDALRRQGKLDEAISCCRRALALKPDFAEAHNNLGAALMEQRERAEAAAPRRRALELDPDFTEWRLHPGYAFRDQANLDEAVACFQRALELSPGFARAHHNLGNAFKEQGNLEEAAACFRRALRLDPSLAEAQSNLGDALKCQGSLEDAVACLRRALELKPDLAETRKNLGAYLLLLGRGEEGWREYEQRLELVTAPRKFSTPRWCGEPAEGRTILIQTEQGFGDALQFVRYAPLVRRRAGARRVILETLPPLARLFTQNCGDWDIEIVSGPNPSASALPPFDSHVPLLSLPLALGLVEPLPMTGPYIRPDPELCRAWRERLGPASAIRVGLAWAGNPRHPADRLRSMRAERLAPLFAIPGFQFYSLQIGVPSGRTQSLEEKGLIDLRGHLADFADTAAFVAELDLVISVDTAVAHLAGAMGRPVWVLLPFVADWRWRMQGESTPWYPTLRLFRQPERGDWDAVLLRVGEELKLLRRAGAAPQSLSIT